MTTECEGKKSSASSLEKREKLTKLTTVGTMVVTGIQLVYSIRCFAFDVVFALFMCLLFRTFNIVIKHFFVFL